MHKGEKIKELMEAKGMTAYHLAPLLGKTPPAIYKMVKRPEINKVLYDAVIKEIEGWDINKVNNVVSDSESEYTKKVNKNDPKMETVMKENEMLKKENEFLKELVSTLAGKPQDQVKGKSRTA